MSSQKISLATSIADKIRAAIVDAQFAFGENLSEESLAAVFEVSRSPVRDALSQLQLEGLVHIIAKSGTYVFNPSVQDVSELCDFRATLEIAAISSIPDDARPVLNQRLATAIAQMEKAVDLGDTENYGRADTAYHRALIDSNQNRHLVYAYSIIAGRVAAIRTHLAKHAEGEPDRSFADHRRIAAMIAARDMEELPEILRHHVQQTRENYLSAMRDRPTAPADLRTERLRRKFAAVAGTP